MNSIEIGNLALALCYTLLIIPFGIIYWIKAPILGDAAISILRMTLQLLFVGLYLQVVFNINAFWLTSLWLLIMIGVADASIVRGCNLRLKRFALPVFISLVFGLFVPLLFFVAVLMRRDNLLDARFAIPLGGMILGNCLRADIIGIRNFYEAIRKSEKAYLNSLAMGAGMLEAVRPWFRDAIMAALNPTIATMATIGLVALPGMMTGVILGGAEPMTAIKYQIAIMIAIFSGTAITVLLAILVTMKSSFTAYGVLDKDIFKKTGNKAKKT
ncbi:MAG: ABC transporter permease [Candidatus Sumerlaeia bacterium]